MDPITVLQGLVLAEAVSLAFLIGESRKGQQDLEDCDLSSLCLIVALTRRAYRALVISGFI